MRFIPPNCRRLQGDADARSRVCRRTFVLQVPDNKADAVPRKRLRFFILGPRIQPGLTSAISERIFKI